MLRCISLLTPFLSLLLAPVLLAQSAPLPGPAVVDAGSLRGKILTGYQGWFRTPGDAEDHGWQHWSRDSKKIAPDTLTFEMWPDTSEFPAQDKVAAPGFTHQDGSQAYLYSSDSAGVVQRHFEWMRSYGLDGVWLQHFVVDLPGAPGQSRYGSRRRILEHVRHAAKDTGRVWALTFDLSGMKPEKLYDLITQEWTRLVDAGVIRDDRYLREGGKPVVALFGFYQNPHNNLPADVGNRLLDFFQTAGPYQAFVMGAGDWKWRQNADPDWQKMVHRVDAYSPWNPGNYSQDQAGDHHASTGYWAEDKAHCDAHGILWIPSLYPGFSWDNLRQKPPGTTLISRRGGRFLWEQFHALSKIGAEGAMVAMFDEVDEATAIFKVSNTPPTQAHFVTYDGLPSDWYLRLTGEATRLLREKQPIPAEIPIKPKAIE